MKKPWEETWTAGEDYDAVHVSEDDQLDMRYGRGDALGRCKLAAAAPEMARLLTWYEWRFNVNGATPEGGCPACGESRLSGHASDCAYVAVMHKAGVIVDADVQPPLVTAAPRLPNGKAIIRRLEQEVGGLRARVAELEQGEDSNLRRKLKEILDE